MNSRRMRSGARLARFALTALLTAGLGSALLAFTPGVAAAQSSCAGTTPPATGNTAENAAVPGTPVLIARNVFRAVTNLGPSGSKGANGGPAYPTIDQVFPASCPFDALVVAQANNNDPKGASGETLTLIQVSSGQSIFTYTLQNIPNNAWDVVDLPAVEPAGTYSLEFSNAVGTPSPYEYTGVVSGASRSPASSQGYDILMGYYPAPAAGAASAAPATVSVVSNAKLGNILVGPNGHTLYYFLKDTKDVNNCTGVCAGLWPVLTASGTPTAGSGVTGTLGTIKLSTGSTQVTYNGWPLYYYVGDTAAGQTNGQGFKNLWYAATPTQKEAPLAATSTSAATLPKTGSGPWPDVAGGALLASGALLLLARRRRTA